MIEQTLAVFLVLALLILVLWFLRRKGLAKMSLAVGGRRTAAGRIQVVDRKALTASHSLHLVRVQDRLILVEFRLEAARRCTLLRRSRKRRTRPEYRMNLVFSPILAFAATPPDGGLLNSIGVSAGNAGHGVTLSVPMQIALGLTLLTLLPAAVMCITPFLRIIVVLHFLRQALGTQSAPSNQVLLGLACSRTAIEAQQHLIGRARSASPEPAGESAAPR